MKILFLLVLVPASVLAESDQPARPISPIAAAKDMEEIGRRQREAFERWRAALVASVMTEPEGPRRQAAARKALVEIEKMRRVMGLKDEPPAPEPKPSSVPGLPPGVEPAKKSVPALPPGMTKGGNP